MTPMIQDEVPLPSPPGAATEGPPSSARTLLVASGAITLALYMLPFGDVLSRPFLLLSTLAHEMGHGLTALLLGGAFQRFAMWPDASGLTEIDLTGFGRLRQALTLAGGLVGPAVVAALCFASGRTSRGARACLLGLGGLLVIAEILVVRNPFGLAFVALVAAACLIAAWRATPTVAQLAVVFVAVQLALSVFSRADYLFVREARNPTGRYPSDVQRMADLLWLPHWFWGALCGAFAIAVLGWGLRIYWRK
jgi:hypothetical protein